MSVVSGGYTIKLPFIAFLYKYPLDWVESMTAEKGPFDFLLKAIYSGMQLILAVCAVYQCKLGTIQHK